MKTTIICVAIAAFFAMAARMYLLFFQRLVLQASYLVPYALSSGVVCGDDQEYTGIPILVIYSTLRGFFSRYSVFPVSLIFFFDLLWFSLIFSILN